MIVFENHGLLDPRLITTLGVNIKSAASPIGFFGTGLKYAIAATLRLGGTIIIQSGTFKYEFTTERSEIKGQSVELIKMIRDENDFQILGFTKEFGKQWLPWQVYRELWSNCQDESGIVYQSRDILSPDSGLTRIYLDGPMFREIHDNLAQYIIDPQRPRVFVDSTLEILPGKSQAIYYRGIRVMELAQPTLYTYNILSSLDLTEDRTVKYSWVVNDLLRDSIFAMRDKRLLAELLVAPESSLEGKLSFENNYTAPSDEFVETVHELKQEKAFVNTSALRRATEVNRSKFMAARRPTDSEQEKIKAALRMLQPLGLRFPSVYMTDDLGDLRSLSHAGDIWLSPKAMEQNLALVILDEYLTINDVPAWGDSRQEWLLNKLLDVLETRDASGE